MSEQERETEEDEGRGPSDTAPLLPRRRPDCRAGPAALLLPSRLLAGLLLHLLLPGAVFLLVLTPAAAVIYLGFLCHSRV
nr:hypothetical protein mPipKuh1_017738 [Pipistrellus kuhlii]